MDVSIIGASEHVRPPMTLVSADAERDVPTFDLDEGGFTTIAASTDLYIAPMTSDSPDEPPAAGRLDTTSHVLAITDGDVVAVVVGSQTPNAVQSTAVISRDSGGPYSVLSEPDGTNGGFRQVIDRRPVESEGAV